MKSELAILAVIIVLVWYNVASVDMGVDRKPYTEIVNSLENLPEPVQIQTTGEKKTIINGEETHITYLAEYTIVGRVVTTRNFENTLWNKRNSISPKDIGIVWGWLSNKEVDSKISWHTNPRASGWSVSDGIWLKSKGGINAIGHNFSNNHLIPSDNNVNKLIKSIRNGDYVKIEGYLVNINYGPNFRMTSRSSTSREDSWDGACETIYVTKVTWLKTR